MSGDPHPRSAHRASPAGGLALLTPQALVRQAQAGRARARQAIIRQAVARQTARLQAARTRGGRAPAPHLRAAHARAAATQTGRTQTDRTQTDRIQAGWGQAGWGQADQVKAGRRQADRIQAGRRQADQVQAGRRQADQVQAGWGQAADRPAWHRVASDRQAAAQHRAGPWPAGPGRQRLAAQQAPQSLMRGLGALIVMAIVGLSVFFVVAEERRGGGRQSAAPPGAEPGIASREVDAEPLTQHEVFPEPSVRLATGPAAYRVTMTHSDSECRIATTGELGALLEDHDCDQVVRARLTAPYGGYQVTTGIFSLADETGADRVSELAGTLVEAGRGSFTTLGGTVGDPLAEPLAQVGWHSRGHYLLYCVVARPDGQLVADDDPHAARITAELVKEYLGEQVIGRRILDP